MSQNLIGPINVFGDLEVRSGEMIIDQSGPNWWTSNNPTIGGESLIVKHTENGRAPGVTFMNDGGGHFVQQFVFGADSNLPNGVAASFWANWEGLVVSAQNNLLFRIGSLETPSAEEGQFSFSGGNVCIGATNPACRLHVVGNNETYGTVFLQSAKGPHVSHIHHGENGDWYVRSAANNGIVVIQDQDPGAYVGVGTSTPTVKLDVSGDLRVSGDILLPNADCAEEFDICDAEKLEPGTVVVMGEKGALQESHTAYDKRVVGVISGARNYRPAITLDRREAIAGRLPIALLGKVYCKVDACYASVQLGDLLTTSPTRGHAMKATDRSLAFGSVIGKALASLDTGADLVPVLIALQ